MTVRRVYTIPPGVSFLDTLVDTLLDGTLVPGFTRDVGPLGLAAATIYVPTRRAARALTTTFAARAGASTLLLPRIRALGALDGLDGGLAAEEPGLESAGSIAPAVDETARRMILTRLILRWSASVKQAILSVPAETGSAEPLLVGATVADAWHLSGELAKLLDEFAIEEVGWDALKPLGTEAFDRYWGITLDFLKIVVEQWPVILGSLGQIDPEARQVALVDAEMRRLIEPGAADAPVVVAGSTGSSRVTARLMAAVAAHDHGAVVLPGLDQRLDEASWEQIDGTRFDPGAAAGHPQAPLRRFLAALGLTRAEVVTLGVVPADRAARSRFVSEALRPADTTDAWQSFPVEDGCLDGITVIEATDEREEALALAVAMRETLEPPDSAVLVTPDRTLARRVREELARWEVEIDDSGGEALAQTAAGTLARLVLDCPRGELEPLAILALLDHPAVRLGRPRATVQGLARLLETVVLRQVLPRRALHDLDALLAATRKRIDDKHAPASLRGLKEDTISDIHTFLREVIESLSPLLSLEGDTPLPAWLIAHEEVIAALTRSGDDDTALRGPDANALAALFEGVGEAGDASILLDCAGYTALFERMAGETPVRGPARSHPRLKILGLVEARLLSSERILLGGLDESVWPPQVRTDAFLNRPMRAALGLTPPERRIGESAHDFVQAMGHRDVIVSRAAKRGGSPTVPSRFLQRMAAVAGPEAWAACRRRGQTYIDLARALDRPDRMTTIARPAPRPPVALRPTKLSVTKVEMLRRDPYAVYAERILRLRPVEPIAAPAGPREWGTLFHGVLGAFAAQFPDDVTTGALQHLRDRLRETFAGSRGDPAFSVFMAPRLERWALEFHAWEMERRIVRPALHIEVEGSLDLSLPDGSIFTLTAQADRIEVVGGIAIRLIDFKTGHAPSLKEVKAGFAPQLTLEAAMAEQGAFAASRSGLPVEAAIYVKFGSQPLINGKLTWKDRTLRDVAAEHLEGLRVLLAGFRDPETGYLARPYPQFVARYSDYDHLSRVKEWSASGGLSDEIAVSTGE